MNRACGQNFEPNQRKPVGLEKYFFDYFGFVLFVFKSGILNLGMYINGISGLIRFIQNQKIKDPT